MGVDCAEFWSGLRLRDVEASVIWQIIRLIVIALPPPESDAKSNADLAPICGFTTYTLMSASAQDRGSDVASPG